jgi:ATP adenylyltransferase
VGSKPIPVMKSTCRFCRIAAGEALTDYDRILMETVDYFAVTSIGGFVEGWTLICAKRHVLNLSNDYRSADFHQFASDVAATMSECYGNPVVFEHGVRCAGSLTGCSTDHAHLHLVPFSGDFTKLVAGFDPMREWSVASPGDVERMTGEREYLMMANSVQEFSSSARLSIVDQPQSQFFRKVLASRLGIADQSDYRLFPFTERVRRASDKLAAMVEQHSAVA